jgi:hypothetical protein
MRALELKREHVIKHFLTTNNLPLVMGKASRNAKACSVSKIVKHGIWPLVIFRKMLSGPYSAWSAAWIAFLSRYRGVSLMQSPMSVTSCEQQSICSDLPYNEKVAWLQGSVAASHSVSRPGPPPGRFSQPFLSAGKNARGVGRAWGLRGRQPLSAVRSRTGEGGGRVQSHPAPKPGGRAQSGGGGSRGWGWWCVCVWAAGQNYVAASPRYLLFYLKYHDGAGVKYPVDKPIQKM